MFEQWLLDNALSSSFRLNELSRKYGILHTVVVVHGNVEIVRLTKTSDNELANEVNGKYFILPSFVETEFIEKVDDVTSPTTTEESSVKPSGKSRKAEK